MLIKSVNKYIQFEVQTRLTPLSMFEGLVDTESDNKPMDTEEYQVATEDDIELFARALSGV